MCIVFFGDRSSLTIKVGRALRRVLGRGRVKLDLWDGYKSKVFITGPVLRAWDGGRP